MKTLFPNQRRSVDFLKQVLHANRGALDGSLTGTGKTVVAAHLAREIGFPVIVVCPKIVIPQWQAELKDAGVTNVLLVTNYEKLRRGNQFITPEIPLCKNGKPSKRGPVSFTWTPPPDTLVIWDEAQRCMSPTSQTSLMLIAAKRAGFMNLMLSATACQDPTEMRAIGFVLGLHGLNSTSRDKLGWIGWMKGYGCRKDHWHKWVSGPKERLVDLNRKMYGVVATKLTPKDLPNAFSENHIITTPLAFSALDEINRFYMSGGITPAIVDMMLAQRDEEYERKRLAAEAEARGEQPEEAEEELMIVKMLRARQLAEAAKVPDIIEMVGDALSEGYSVVVFVNFTDTVHSLKSFFGSDAAVVVGGQSSTFREINVQDFQTNRKRLIICNTAAGGVGVSLHDTDGNYPRMSFISPTFNSKEYTQTLGRIHRVGAKSPATQRILVASGTIEEYVLTRMEEKRNCLDTLHQQQQP
jgi:hypothetical protein